MAKRETVIGKEIAILEKALSTAPEKVKIKLKSKIARLKKEAKGIPMSAKQLANNVLRQKQKLKELSKTDFNNLIRQLSKKPEYAFLKSMTKDEIIRDINRKAKPAGWRFKGRGDYRNPTKRDIANRGTNGVYWEARRERSDVSQAAQLKKGGEISRYSDFTNKVVVKFIEKDNGDYVTEVLHYPSGELKDKSIPTKVKSLASRSYIKKLGENTDGILAEGKFTEWIKSNKFDKKHLKMLNDIAKQYNVKMPTIISTYAKGGETQGYNDRMDESLGMRHRGPKSQSHKDRRDEAKGMNKAMGDRAYQSVGTMDKKENGGEIEIEEPEIVRYYFEDDAYEYETGGKPGEGGRFLISIPYYADSQKEAEACMLKIAKATDVPVISLSSQFEKDNYKRKPLVEIEYDNGREMDREESKENGGEIEAEPEIVRYYFEDDAYEYKNGGTMSDGKGMKFRLESANEDLKRVAKFVDSNPMVKKAMDKTVNGFNIDSALGDALVATDLSDDEVFEFKVNGKSFDEYGKGGNLKSVPGDNKGLSKLPKSVRNKMGYMEEGGEMEQGYNDRDDESLGMSHRGMKKQSYKSRRDESKGERKFMGKRAYRDDK